MNTEALYKISYGLYILTAHEGDKENGCIVNTVMQITEKPNRIAVAVNNSNYTHGMIERTGVFNVSVLTEQSKFATYKRKPTKPRRSPSAAPKTASSISRTNATHTSAQR